MRGNIDFTELTTHIPDSTTNWMETGGCPEAETCKKHNARVPELSCATVIAAKQCAMRHDAGTCPDVCPTCAQMQGSVHYLGAVNGTPFHMQTRGPVEDPAAIAETMARHLDVLYGPEPKPPAVPQGWEQ